MKRMFVLLIATSALWLTVSAHAVNCYDVTSKDCISQPARPLPTSVEDFLKLRDQIGKDPWGGASLFMYAWMVRLQDKKLGNQLLVLSLSESELGKSDAGGIYKGYSWGGNIDYLLAQADKYPYCGRSYAVGSSPANNYKMDPKSVAIRFRKQMKYVGSIESGKFKVFVCSSGADTCRPLSLRRNERGFWKVLGFSTLAVSCKPLKAKSKASQDL